MREKNQDKHVNPLTPPSIVLDHIPLANRGYRINEIQCGCDFLYLYCFLEGKYGDKMDQIGLWEYNLPHYIFP